MVLACERESLTSTLPCLSHLVAPVFRLVQNSLLSAAAVGAPAMPAATAPAANTGMVCFNPIRMMAPVRLGVRVVLGSFHNWFRDRAQSGYILCLCAIGSGHHRVSAGHHRRRHRRGRRWRRP